MPGQSGNPGGKPQGLAKLAREAVGDGAELVQFMTAILRGEAKSLGVRQLQLRDRMAAAQWLSERGWGRAPLVVVDTPEDLPQMEFREALRAWVGQLPSDVRELLERRLDEEWEAEIDREIAKVDRKVQAMMPEPPIQTESDSRTR
jgi:hypothetical protein